MLYCQFLWIVLLFIAPLVFSNIYLSCVPYIVSFSGLSFYLLPLWYSLTFIYLVYPILSVSLDCPFIYCPFGIL
jgi:hypothetical protein